MTLDELKALPEGTQIIYDYPVGSIKYGQSDTGIIKRSTDNYIDINWMIDSSWPTATYFYASKQLVIDLAERSAVIYKPVPMRTFSGQDYNTTCKRCGAPAYIGLQHIECSRGCHD